MTTADILESMRNIKINRRLLKTAAAIDILAFVIFFIFKLDERNWILLTPALAALLFFVALKFPDMACSKVLAGICTFMVITAVMIGPLLFGIFGFFICCFLGFFGFCCCCHDLCMDERC